MADTWYEVWAREESDHKVMHFRTQVYDCATDFKYSAQKLGMLGVEIRTTGDRYIARRTDEFGFSGKKWHLAWKVLCLEEGRETFVALFIHDAEKNAKDYAKWRNATGCERNAVYYPWGS